jgi:hypothetical protein
MHHLEYPSRQLWDERRRWVEELAEPPAALGGYSISEQAAALSADVQAAFCAGAWLAVVVLAAAAIDAQLREDAAPGFTGNAKELMTAVGLDARFQELRKRRNALVHVSPDEPAVTVDIQWNDRRSLEKEAQDAVQLMFETFYLNPWV